MIKNSLLLFVMFLVVGCSNKSSEHNYSVNEDNYHKIVKELFYEHKANFDKKYGYRELELEIVPFPKQGSSARALNADGKLVITKSFKRLLRGYNLYFSIDDLNGLRKYANSYEDHKMLNEVIDASKEFKFFTPEEQFLLVEHVILHELSHLYFIKRNSPFYSPEINLIRNGKFEIWKMRDELYAEFLTLLILKEKYKNNEMFQSFLKKLSQVRLNEGTDYALLNTGNHIFYALYTNLGNIHKVNSYNIDKITEMVDEMTIRNLYMFGTGLENRKDFDLNQITEDVIKEVEIITNSCLYYFEKNVDNCFNYNAVTRKMYYKLDDIERYKKKVKEVLELFFKIIKR